MKGRKKKLAKPKGEQRWRTPFGGHKGRKGKKKKR